MKNELGELEYIRHRLKHVHRKLTASYITDVTVRLWYAELKDIKHRYAEIMGEALRVKLDRCLVMLHEKLHGGMKHGEKQYRTR